MGFEDPSCTIFVKNLEPRVSEEILWELFIQAGPLKSVSIPTDRSTGSKRGFAFVTYKDDVSVPYACEMFNQVRLYKKPIYCNPSDRGAKRSFNQSTESAPTSPSSPTSSNNSLIQGILNRSNSVSRDIPLTSTPFNGKRKFSSQEDDRSVVLVDDRDDRDRSRYSQHDDRDRRSGGGRYDFFGGGNSRDERDGSAYRSNDRKFNDRNSSQGSRFDRSNSYNSSYGNTSPMHVQALNQSQRQYGRQNSSPRGDFERSPRGDGGQSNFGNTRNNNDSQRNNRRQR